VAFILADQRLTEAQRNDPVGAYLPRLPRYSEPRRRSINLGGAAVSLFVHGLLFLAIIVGLFGKAPEIQKQLQPGGSLVMFDVSQIRGEEPHAEESASAPPQPQKTETLVSKTPAPEWSERKMLAPADKANAPAQAAVGTGGNGSAPSSGGGDGFDPYAGAAPLRSWNAPAGATPPAISAGQRDINMILGGRLIAVARSRWPALRGSCTFLLTLDAQGQILSAQWKAGSLATVDRERVRSLLLDHGLGPVGPANAKLVLGPVSL